MKTTFIAPAFVGTAFAAVASRAPNGLCALTSNSTAPTPLVNTLAGFNEWTGYTVIALKAQKPTGYETTLANANCAISSSKYMLYSKLETYDVQACARICDAHRGCDAFNIYVQREPSVPPSAGCPNPQAIFSTICALYSEPVSFSQCTNLGQYVGPEDANGEAFKIAVRASNIYARLPAKDTSKVVTTTSNISYDKPNVSIQTLLPLEITTAKGIEILVSKLTSLQSMATAVSTPPSILNDMKAALSKLESVKPTASTISQTASSLSAPASVTSVASSAQQANNITSQTAIVLPAPTIVLPSIITQVPPVKEAVMTTIKLMNFPPASTTFTAPVLLGTPFAQQVNTPTSKATSTPAPVAHLIATPPGTPSASLVNTVNTILQSKLSTLLTSVISRASSISQVATPTVTQSSAPTAIPTAPAAKMLLPPRKRWNWTGRRHGYLNKP